MDTLQTLVALKVERPKNGVGGYLKDNVVPKSLVAKSHIPVSKLRMVDAFTSRL